MTHLRIATFNTWNCQGALDQRLPLMIAGLKDLDADAVLLQEVFVEVPSGIDVAGRLADGLGMDVAFVSARKKLRTMNASPVLSFSGLAVLTRDPIHRCERVRLPDDPRDGERLGQLVSVSIKGLDVVLANVHLSHLSNEDDLRRRQLDAMVDALGEMHAGDMTVLGGDMNLAHGHRVLEDLSAGSGFQPVAYELMPKSTLNPIDGTLPDMGVIDHLFVKHGNGNAPRAQGKIVLNQRDRASQHYPSDHAAVVVDIDVD